jgi:hypothetical protein
VAANAILDSFMSIGAEHLGDLHFDQLLPAVAQLLGNLLPSSAAI